jgi:phosphatidylglycerol---prolipoprotein diacylglyceryl transferase
MFPKFSDILNYLFGSHLDLPMQTYGFFLAIAFLTAGLLLRSELKRKEKEGLLTIRKQTIYPNKPVSWFGVVPGILLSSIIGWKLFGIIFQYADFASNPQKFLLSSKGSLSALLIIVCISILYQLYKRRNASKSSEQSYEEIIHPYQNTWNILVVGIILAIIGSKLFDIIDNFSDFLQNPIHSLILFSGLTFYGGFIVTVIGLLIYMRYIKLDWKHVIDSTAPAIMIGYAIGRLGCHFSGDGCWGIVNTLTQPGWLSWLPDWLWASNYPHNVINHGIPIPGCFGPNCHVLDKPVFPTSLYESIISFCSFGILWFMRKRIKAPVSLFGLYMILNGLERFVIEKIRINNKYNVFGLQLTQAEIISSALIIIGIVVMIYFTKRYKVQTKELI